MQVLVVDDHAETRSLLRRGLERDGHKVVELGTVQEALAWLKRPQCDVIVLDVMLPDGSGFELCRALRREGLQIPILLLTARGEVGDRVEGLNAGADDYLAKPFAVSELQARVRALGRRGPVLRDTILRRGEVVIDLSQRSVTFKGTPVALTAREFAILELLGNRKGIVTRQEILESIWGDLGDEAASSMEVLIGRLRRKLGGGNGVIQTVRGMGYGLGEG